MPSPRRRPLEHLDGGRVRVLVTGAGGPAAVGFMQALFHQPIDFFAVDIDPFAAGLHLVPTGRSALVERAEAPGFVDSLLACCDEWAIDLLVPTVDAELGPVAAARGRFERAGVEVAVASVATLQVALDKLALARRLVGTVAVPHTETAREVLEAGGPDAADFKFPLVVKPRRGSGSRGVHLVTSAADFAAVAEAERFADAGDDWIVQAYLPGDEYSVDVLARRDGTIAAAVPRARLKVDSGVAVAARTVHDPELERCATAVAFAIGLTGVANVQLRRDAAGRPVLLEVNPRLPGTMSLTVAAGVDMPYWLVIDALGGTVPADLAFREVGVVRTLADRYVPVDAFDRVALVAAARGVA